MAARDKERISGWMWWVIVSKAITAIVLACACVLLVLAGKENPADFFSRAAVTLFKGNPPGIAISFIVSKTLFLSTAMVTRLAAATAAYAALEVVESAGLAKRQRWAEWLTILVTASLIPFELSELVKDPTAVKAGTLAMNLAVLAYLIARQLAHRRRRRGARGVPMRGLAAGLAHKPRQELEPASRS